jgi:hypothetical protein
MKDANRDVRVARTQIVARYLRSERRIATVERPSVDKHGRTRRVRGNVVTERVRVVVTSYERWVDMDVVDDGLLWMAWNWEGPGPTLPKDWI